MFYNVLADLLVVGHIAFVVFVVTGGFLVLRRPRVALLHLPLAAWGASVEFFGWICPLTPWEVNLRRLGGEAGYAEGFIEHYLLPVLYPTGLGRREQLVLGALVICVNVGIYAWVISKRIRRQPAGAEEEGGP